MSFATLSAQTQTDIGMSIQSGYNRIGLYFDSAIIFNLKQHHVKTGIRYYGPDYVFEKNSIGLSLGYKYLFKSNSWFFGPGVSAAFFHENKSAVSLTVSEMNISNTIGFQLNDRVALFSGIGIGTVINQHINVVQATTANTSYINYEFSLGINYLWRTHSDI